MKNTMDSYSHLKRYVSNSCSQWTILKLVAHQSWCSSEFHTRSIIFLVFINDLAEESKSVAKLSSDDVLFFWVAHDLKTKGLSLNEDLLKICQRIYQWKIFFNPDASKQDQEIFFIRKKIYLCMELFSLPI